MKETYHYDSLADRLTVARTEDISAVIEANKRQYEVDNKRHKSEAFNHYARIPLIAIEQYCQQHGIKFQEFMNNEKLIKRFLNDPDNKMFRTRPGRI